MNNKTKGFSATIISAIFFGLIPFFVKTIYAGGANSLTATFLRFALSLPTLVIILKIQGISLKVTKKDFLNIVFITVFGYGGTSVLLFSSYNYLPSGMCTTIHFMYPVFTILGCVLFLKEKINPIKILCAGLCIAGILFFYDGESSISLVGMSLAFFSSITYAFYTIYLKSSGLQEIGMIKLIFYMNAVASVMLLILSVASAQLTLNLTPGAWETALFFATFSSLIGVLGYQVGVKCIGPENAAILSTFEPITSVVMGIVVYSEEFSPRLLLGCLCILSSVIIVSKIKD